MHKSFYASGFLYHSPTHQILLQQFDSLKETNFSLFSGKSKNGHDPKTVFQICIEEELGVSIAANAIHEVYDYVHHRLGEHFIFYVEVKGATPKSYSSKNKTEWFSLAKLSKYTMSEQTRHDIIVGERVIRHLLDSANAKQIAKGN